MKRKGAHHKGAKSGGRVQAEKYGTNPTGGSAGMNGGKNYTTHAQGVENKAPTSGSGR
jgi:hypothetical protein